MLKLTYREEDDSGICADTWFNWLKVCGGPVTGVETLDIRHRDQRRN